MPSVDSATTELAACALSAALATPVVPKKIPAARPAVTNARATQAPILRGFISPTPRFVGSVRTPPVQRWCHSYDAYRRETACRVPRSATESGHYEALNPINASRALCGEPGPNVEDWTSETIDFLSYPDETLLDMSITAREAREQKVLTLSVIEEAIRSAWSRLVGGVEIDLTRGQFTDGETIGRPTVAPPPGRPTRCAAHYDLLRSRVRSEEHTSELQSLA